MAKNFRVKISDIGPLIYIHRFGILKRRGISQFQLQKIQCRWSGYIV